jgi:hypothetical protein
MEHLRAWQQWAVAIVLTLSYPCLLYATKFWFPGEKAAIQEAVATARQWLNRPAAVEKEGSA